MENELKKLKLENEILKKDNKNFKFKKSQYNNVNCLIKNKKNINDINKIDENIENVSIELREIEENKKIINN